MARLTHWEIRLAELIESTRAAPFKWGERDCILWGADCVRAQTGHDPAAQFRGRYRLPFGATKMLREVGDGTVEAAICWALGDPLPVAEAGPGDIALVDVAKIGASVGVVSLDGANVHVIAPAGGLVDVPLADAIRVWKVA